MQGKEHPPDQFHQDSIWGLYSSPALTQSSTTASSQSMMPSLIFQALGSIPVVANDVGGVGADRPESMIPSGPVPSSGLKI